ncbi:MAG: flavodoxin family protein [Candidatus Methanolliviera hydrocarbonicum]|uniref:Flavodoxin family protein n=1 Tax=Candidatus Methanolliviera hydrocarbonicum TaxID=2491085 RepID=A0A520KVK4_9EURY|nr:MAG: flavodoxin family protein [Candidatus Methanolliviera hydrocarbonicum]
MKVLALNGSPRMKKGNTALILDPFLEGMREEGAEVELYYTKNLKINPCQGKFICWTKTPGKCWQKDDMQMLLPKICEADILVLGTPVYLDSVSGPIKNVMDRMIPLVHGTIEMRDGHCRHPLREECKRGKVVLVSNCGFWEIDNFDPMIVQMKAWCKNTSREFAGALIRPHGEGLRPAMKMGLPVDEIFDAAKEAGRQLVKEGKMSLETLKIVSRELMPLEMYVQSVNDIIQYAIEAEIKLGKASLNSLKKN